VARGAAQYVILGAGFDSFALRQPAFAKGIQIFEVDHPATQQLKRRQIEAAGIAAPPNVHFFDADLSREPLSAALDRGNYRRTAVSFVAWLGVTMYLPREANLLTLKAVAQCSAFGSEIVFTYIEQQAFDHPSRGFDRLRASAAALGEPWLSGFDPETLAADLKGVGLTLVEDLDSEDMMERYCRGRTDGLRPGTSGRIARARVGLIPV
jgi:methyltransferase (TIGR00027 family)